LAVLYTTKDITNALHELRIRPVDGMVTGVEAARILTWRALSEQGIEHQYRASAIRRHVEKKNLVAHPRNERFNLYKVEDVFGIALVPKRGIQQMKTEAKHAA
jgi:hypothetical protein